MTLCIGEQGESRLISFEDGFLSRAQFMASETSITFLFMMIPSCCYWWSWLPCSSAVKPPPRSRFLITRSKTPIEKSQTCNKQTFLLINQTGQLTDTRTTTHPAKVTCTTATGMRNCTLTTNSRRWKASIVDKRAVVPVARSTAKRFTIFLSKLEK